MPTMPVWVDTHCHLDKLKSLPLADLLKAAKLAGLTKLVTVTAEDEQDLVLALADKYADNQYPLIFTTQGVHPHAAKDFHHESLIKLKTNAAHPKVKAIGEIGLDYHYDFSPREDQQRVFREQMQAAIDLKLPIIIHTREAEEDTFKILQEFLPQIKSALLKLEVHSFNGSVKFAQWCMAQDFYFGVNGMITFPKSEELREIVKTLPLHRLLLETDAPYLAPVPHRGKENHSAFIPVIGQYLANLLGIKEEDLASQTTANAAEFFDI